MARRFISEWWRRCGISGDTRVLFLARLAHWPRLNFMKVRQFVCYVNILFSNFKIRICEKLNVWFTNNVHSVLNLDNLAEGDNKLWQTITACLTLWQEVGTRQRIYFWKGQDCFSSSALPHPPWEPLRLLSNVYDWPYLGQNDWSVKLTARHILVLKTKRFSSASRHSSLYIASS